MLQALLTDVREIVAEGNWGELAGALQRIQGTPNNAEANLRDAAYSEPRPSHVVAMQRVTLAAASEGHRNIYSISSKQSTVLEYQLEYAC